LYVLGDAFESEVVVLVHIVESVLMVTANSVSNDAQLNFLAPLQSLLLGVTI
jgi:hypothetical protein